MTRAAASVSVRVDGLEDAAKKLGAVPSQVAVAGARASYDLHGPRGFIRNRLLSRGAGVFRNRSVGRRFMAAKLDEGGAYHRRAGKITIDRIEGETFSVAPELETHIAGARRAPAGLELLPAFSWSSAKPRERRRFRLLSRAIERLGLKTALAEMTEGNTRMVYIGRRRLIVALRTRRGKAHRTEPVASYGTRGPSRRTIDLDAVFSDLSDKAHSIFDREIRKELRDADKRARVSSVQARGAAA